MPRIHAALHAGPRAARRWLAAGIIAAIAVGAPPAARAEQDAKLVAVIQTFLSAMAHRDADLARTVTVPEGRFTSVREIEGKRVVRGFTNQDDIAGWATRSENVLERIWNPEVRIYGHLAVVTAPYDFYRSGKFSHCGTDVFQLLETEEGWRVAGGTYTVELTGCLPSPLGPPKF